MSKAITLRPRLSEKTYGLSESRVYVVEIDKDVVQELRGRAVDGVAHLGTVDRDDPNRAVVLDRDRHVTRRRQRG